MFQLKKRICERQILMCSNCQRFQDEIKKLKEKQQKERMQHVVELQFMNELILKTPMLSY